MHFYVFGRQKLIDHWRRKGRFVGAYFDPVTDRKVIVHAAAAGQVATVLDLATGMRARQVKIGDASTVDVQMVGDELLVIETHGDPADGAWSWSGSWTKITVRDARGRIRSVVWLPGRFLRGASNGRDAKAIVTETDGRIHQFLVQEEWFGGSDGPVVHELPEEALQGTLAHYQYDNVGGEDRWVLAVYDPAGNKTTVRVFGAGNQVLSTTVFPGRPVEGPPGRFLTKFGHQKAFATQGRASSYVRAISLEDGRLIGSRSLRGQLKYVRLIPPPNGGGAELELENEAGKKARLRLPR